MKRDIHPMKRNTNPNKSKISHFGEAKDFNTSFKVTIEQFSDRSRIFEDKNPFLSFEDQLERDAELTLRDEQREELLDRVYEAMRLLTPKQQDVIRMCILEEQSFVKVAKQLDVNVTAVQHCLNGQSASYKGKRAHTGGALNKLRNILNNTPYKGSSPILNEEIVREIRASSLPARVFTEKYGISQNQVSRVRTFKVWKNLSPT